MYEILEAVLYNTKGNMVLSLSLLQQCSSWPRGSATKGTKPDMSRYFRSRPSPCSCFGMPFLSDIVVRDWDSHSCGLLSLSEQIPSLVVMFIRVP